MRSKDPSHRSCQKKPVILFVILLSFALGLRSTAQARMILLRSVLDIPEHCRSVKPAHFSQGFSKILMSVEELPSEIRGVQTLQFPYSRSDIQSLWKYLRARVNGSSRAPLLSPTGKNSDIQETVDALLESHQDHGIDFRAEGDVLEMIGLLHFEKEYPSSEYFVYSGLAYGKGETQILGELDLVVARRSDCGVVLIGEAKVNGNSLKEGHSQLQRFENWLQTQFKPRSAKSLCATPFHF